MRKSLLLVICALLIAGTAYAGQPGSFCYVKTQDAGTRCRGLGVWGVDDVIIGVGSAPRGIQMYHNMNQGTGLYDCYRTTFVKGPGDTLALSYNWGIAIHDNLAYQTMQITAEPESYILVWDYACNEVDYLALGIDPSGTEYPTACDADAAGNLYMSLYIDGVSFDQVTVYPPLTSWVAHTAAPIQSLETGAYVGEGVCVTADGSTIYATNRSAPGTNGWCKKFDGSVVGGYTEDLGFVCPIDGYVRGVEIDETHGFVYVIQDGGTPDGRVFICDAFTGAKLDSIVTVDLGTYHNSPYDIEYDPIGQDLYVQHYYGWYVDRYHWNDFTAVSMSSFEATAGEGMVNLSWRVESETDNAGFRLYRDGSEIAFVKSLGNSETARTYTWIDQDVTPGVTYTYRIADVDIDGSESMHEFEATVTPMSISVPTEFSLAQNYPNPFNADTQIEFSLAQAGHTNLTIYNTTGQVVRTLVDGQMDARVHQIRWNGRNESGQLVSSGIYFYRLASGTFAETKKMSFIR
ncbi:T9SS type A sorting domain-containing protein [Candidatus Zixiibacteriota bacterium]